LPRILRADPASVPAYHDGSFIHQGGEIRHVLVANSPPHDQSRMHAKARIIGESV